MAYKVGDLVRIKTWDQMVEEYGTGESGNIQTLPVFVDSMKKHCGTVMEIKWASGETPFYQSGYYRMQECEDWMFPEDSIECAVSHPEEQEKHKRLPFPDDRVARHEDICEELTSLYERKNHDYGNSFGDGMREYGMIMPVIRLEDKLRRLKSLVKSGDIKVQDESIRDTLMDLANYSIMTLIEMDAEGSE